jgi:hypothetical protein
LIQYSEEDEHFLFMENGELKVHMTATSEVFKTFIIIGHQHFQSQTMREFHNLAKEDLWILDNSLLSSIGAANQLKGKSHHL